MKSMLSFIKTTFTGGLVFLFPIFILVIIARKVFEVLFNLLAPIEKLLPQQHALGMEMPRLASALVIVLVSFLIGLFAKTRRGTSITKSIERFALGWIPGYSLFRGTTGDLLGTGGEQFAKPALAWIEECWMLGFVMETLENGFQVVFVPSIPTPAAGSMYFLQPERVKLLDASSFEAIKCVTRLGVGSRKLIGTSL
jgi:uncharacterized membrane protein